VGFFDALGLKQWTLGRWSMGGGIVQHVALQASGAGTPADAFCQCRHQAAAHV